MAQNYGPMIGCESAITWVESLNDIDKNIQERVIRRMRYEFNKDIPVKPVFHKGKYGAKYDSYTCGQCGKTLDAWYKFCPECGYMIGKREYH